MLGLVCVSLVGGSRTPSDWPSPPWPLGCPQSCLWGCPATGHREISPHVGAFVGTGQEAHCPLTEPATLIRVSQGGTKIPCLPHPTSRPWRVEERVIQPGLPSSESCAPAVGWGRTLAVCPARPAPPGWLLWASPVPEPPPPPSPPCGQSLPCPPQAQPHLTAPPHPSLSSHPSSASQSLVAKAWPPPCRALPGLVASDTRCLQPHRHWTLSPACQCPGHGWARPSGLAASWFLWSLGRSRCLSWGLAQWPHHRVSEKLAS